MAEDETDIFEDDVGEDWAGGLDEDSGYGLSADDYGLEDCGLDCIEEEESAGAYALGGESLGAETPIATTEAEERSEAATTTAATEPAAMSETESASAQSDGLWDGDEAWDGDALWGSDGSDNGNSDDNNDDNNDKKDTDMSTPTGYVNGSDLLLFVSSGAVGHCTTHTITFNAESKSRVVKPAASKGITSALWDEKSVNKMSASITAEGVRYYDEAEQGYQALLAAYAKGEAVTVSGYERGKNDSSSTPTNDKPYFTGSFIITSIEETSPAGDDATYSISLESAGEITITAANLTTKTA